MSGLFDDVLANVGEPYKGGKGFEYGTHEVIIMSAEAKTKETKANPKAEIIEVIVEDAASDSDRTATCTLYFHTEGGAKMGVTKILGILVHNMSEEKKDQVRELGKKTFGSIDDPIKARDVAVKLLQAKMIGMKAYLVAEPGGKYKTTNYGDLWHYAAEPQNEPVVVAKAEEAEVPFDDDVDFGEL